MITNGFTKDLHHLIRAQIIITYNLAEVDIKGAAKVINFGSN